MDDYYFTYADNLYSIDFSDHLSRVSIIIPLHYRQAASIQRVII